MFLPLSNLRQNLGRSLEQGPAFLPLSPRVQLVALIPSSLRGARIFPFPSWIPVTSQLVNRVQRIWDGAKWRLWEITEKFQISPPFIPPHLLTTHTYTHTQTHTHMHTHACTLDFESYIFKDIWPSPTSNHYSLNLHLTVVF